jgi:hypothetical protein
MNQKIIQTIFNAIASNNINRLISALKKLASPKNIAAEELYALQNNDGLISINYNDVSALVYAKNIKNKEAYKILLNYYIKSLFPFLDHYGNIINGNSFYNTEQKLENINTKTENSPYKSSLHIKFFNNSPKYFNLSESALTTTNNSQVVTVELMNHGLSTGDVIDLNLTAAVNNIHSETNIAITVINEYTFTYTTTGAAANADGTGGAATDGFKLLSNPSRCYSMLDGNIININGIVFTAKNTGTFSNYTGAVGQIKTKSTQTPAELATEVKVAIDHYIIGNFTGFEKLLGVEIKINPSDSSELLFTHKSAGAAGNDFYVRTENGTQIINNNIKYVDPVTKVLTGGGTGDLTQMNVQIYGTSNDSILNTFAGAKPKASFTFSTNPSDTIDTGPTINAANASINADGTAIKVTVNGHGYRGGETITIAGGAGVALASNTGITVGAGSYTVRILDKDTYELYGTGLLTGTFTGYQGPIAGRLLYTHPASWDRGDRINVNGKEFKYVASLTGDDDEILIGANIAATIKNTVEILNRSTDPRVLLATYSGEIATCTVTATYKAYGTGNDHYFTLGGNARSNNLIISNSTLTDGASPKGVDVSKVTNNDKFIGKFKKKFKALYDSYNNVDLSIKVGDHTYTAEKVNTLPRVATWATFISANGGGSFKLEMAAGNGSIVSDKEAADTFAKRFDNALSGFKIVQRREISSFHEASDIKNGTVTIGSLQNAKIFFNNDKFDNIQIDKITFAAPDAAIEQTDATIEFVIDGEIYCSHVGIGCIIDKGSLLKLYNVSDCNRYVELRIGHQNLDLSTSSNAEIIQNTYFHSFASYTMPILYIEDKLATDDFINIALFDRALVNKKITIEEYEILKSYLITIKEKLFHLDAMLIERTNIIKDTSNINCLIYKRIVDTETGQFRSPHKEIYKALFNLFKENFNKERVKENEVLKYLWGIDKSEENTRYIFKLILKSFAKKNPNLDLKCLEENIPFFETSYENDKIEALYTTVFFCLYPEYQAPGILSLRFLKDKNNLNDLIESIIDCKDPAIAKDIYSTLIDAPLPYIIRNKLTKMVEKHNLKTVKPYLFDENINKSAVEVTLTKDIELTFDELNAISKDLAEKHYDNLIPVSKLLKNIKSFDEEQNIDSTESLLVNVKEVELDTGEILNPQYFNLDALGKFAEI